MNSKQFMMQCYKLGQAVASRQQAQQLSTSVVRRGTQDVHPNYLKIREKYRKFQANPEVPIHLKGGSFDYFLYFTTLTLCVAGVAGCFHFYYTTAFPKKPAE